MSRKGSISNRGNDEVRVGIAAILGPHSDYTASGAVPARHERPSVSSLVALCLRRRSPHSPSIHNLKSFMICYSNLSKRDPLSDLSTTSKTKHPNKDPPMMDPDDCAGNLDTRVKELSSMEGASLGP